MTTGQQKEQSAPARSAGTIDVDAWRGRIREDAISNYFYEMGLALRREGSLAAAADHFRRAVDAAPGMVEAHFRLHQTLTKLGRDADATAAFRHAQAVDPHFQARALFRIGRDHLRNGRLAEAEGSLAAAARDWPDCSLLPVYSAMLLTRQGKFDEAAGRLDGIAADGASGHGDTADDLVEAGNAAFTAGCWPLATRFMELADAIDPESPQVRLAVALTRLGTGDLSGLERLLSDVGSTKWFSPAALARTMLPIGLALYNFGRPAESEWVLRRVLELNPDEDGNAHMYLGLALLGQGRVPDAADALQTAVGIAPHNAQAHANLGLALQAAGRYEEGIAAGRRALKEAVPSFDMRRHLGSLLQFAGHLDEAAAIFEHDAAADPWSALQLAMADLARGRLPEAETAARDALAREPDAVQMAAGLGLVLHARGDLAAAADVYDRMTRSTMLAGFQYSNVGLLAQSMGRLEKAEAIQRKAVSMAPNLSWPRTNLGLVLLETGREEEGIEAIRTAARAQPYLLWFQMKLRPWLGTTLSDLYRRLNIDLPPQAH